MEGGEVTVARLAHALRRFWALGVAVVLGGGVLAGSAVANAPQSEPDLVALLPTTTGHIAPIYVDTHTVPGKELYRFSAVIKNLGGAMDLYKDPSTGAAMQVIWPGGDPTSMPDPNIVPSGGEVHNLTQANGAYFIFNPSQGHNHWHFQQAAQYSLIMPDGTIRYSDKVGFCMWDSWVMDGGSSTKYFPVFYKGVGPTTWCAPRDPSATFTHMGISRNYGDLYAAQSTDQWVDITGLTPGPYRIRGVVNPNGYIIESDPNNNDLTVTRTIPGTKALDATTTTTAGITKTFEISGEVFAPDVPARNGIAVGQPGCSDVRKDIGCYTFTSANGPLTFDIGQQPQHGSVTIESHSGVHATVRYVPDSGFQGTDSFTFRVTDGRGLTSDPGTVTVKTTAPKVHTSIAASVSRHVGARYTYIYVHGKLSPATAQNLTLHYKGVHATRWTTLRTKRTASNGTVSVTIRMSHRTNRWATIDATGHAWAITTRAPQGAFQLRWTFGGSGTETSAVSRTLLTKGR